MKKIINIFFAAALALGAVSCSQESPFDAGEKGNGYGRVLTSSLAVQLKGEQTRAANDTPDVKDFTVEFFNVSNLDTPVESYKYSEMPEIVTLPAGVKYKVVARYGENPEAAWNAPYYYGESTDFDVVVDKIVDNIDPITCRLSNVKVSINFDRSLVDVMSPDSKVNVKVGTSGELPFTIDTKDYGYFAYVEGSNTLIATFTGTVDGDPTTEIKSYTDVKPGVHYSITFRMHSPNASGTGTITTPEEGNSGINIEAAVTISDISGEIDLGDDIFEEIILDDESERPTEGSDDNPNTPDNPSQGDDPNQGDEPSVPDTPSTGGPKVTAEEPIDLNAWNVAVDGLHCVLNVHSDTGITGFSVTIDSETLTEEMLTEVGLAGKFDLINPADDDLAESLTGLGLPIKDEVKDQNDVKFDVSEFMGLLGLKGAGNHRFILTVSDASGTTIAELKLRTE